MRRRLVLVRHAKSDWGDPAVADHDRPLAPRGVKALSRMSDHLLRQPPPPDIVLCSSAHRATDTLAGIRTALPPSVRIEVSSDLYVATVDTILEHVRGLGDDVECALVIGHNPTLQDLATLLAGEGDVAHRAQLATKFPTGAVVTISFRGGWIDVGADAGRLETLFMPRPPRS